ncbi:hypothetical protein [Nostoc sp. 'Lobaria pulmonaria (5183) cyanobiont']|uniref:hypothetical protein n=1 Tax=Nostoc sp. 'Lobaria pulmonaria (5183) cyanobiont' TaxID=1618022 RepID=UPI000CF35B11|nr:hypothetical protein [Nostoc sp. 'Lobaria pulmonaria (5183) cyanobiont']
MSRVIKIITTDGLVVEIDTTDVDFIEVQEEGLTDDDYTEARYFHMVMKDEEEYLLDVLDNLGCEETLLNLFQTM